MIAKDFQEATANRIVELFRQGHNRVLLADEVGLGKTIVAKTVVEKTGIWRKEVEKDEYVLSSNDFVYIKTYESLCMPNDLCCNVVEKNSLMRLGLKVDGPLYQPGHKTNVFLNTS